MRVSVTGDEVHDLLMTNYPVSHARDAEQFVAFARTMSGNRALGVVKLAFAVGPGEAIRMLCNILDASNRPVSSLALESFWSRSAILWGAAGPMRYLIRPTPAAASTADDVETTDPDFLRKELAGRLAQGDVTYEFCLQRFVDEAQTPIEDAAVAWSEAVAPPVVVGRLVTPAQDVLGAEADAIAGQVDQMAFNPWLTTDDFRPLGNLNRARRAVYDASASQRLGQSSDNGPPTQP